MEPILVIFEDRKEKEIVWTKLRDNLKTKTNVVVTQDTSTKRMAATQDTSTKRMTQETNTKRMEVRTERQESVTRKTSER